MVRNLERVYQAAGIPIELLINNWEDVRVRTLPSGTHKLRLTIFGSFSLDGILKALILAPRTLFRTYKMLNSSGATGIYFHYPSTDALGTMILKKLGLFSGRVALCFHGTDVRAPSNAFEAAIWRWMFNRADGITTCSKSLAIDVERIFDVPNDRISVVYNGVDTKIFSPAPREVGPEQVFPGKYIVSVGSFIPRKGHRYLLNAFGKVAQRHQHFGLVIVGGDGEERAPLQAWIDEHGFGDRIKLLVGLTPAGVAEVVKGAVMCVQPSIAEPFGMAVIEAGACGVLVAASAVGGHVELIEHGKTGLLFEPEDTESIAMLLEAYFKNPTNFKEPTVRFREQILQQFTWESCVEKYNEVIGIKLVPLHRGFDGMGVGRAQDGQGFGLDQ